MLGSVADNKGFRICMSSFSICEKVEHYIFFKFVIRIKVLNFNINAANINLTNPIFHLKLPSLLTLKIPSI